VTVVAPADSGAAPRPQEVTSGNALNSSSICRRSARGLIAARSTGTTGARAAAAPTARSAGALVRSNSLYIRMTDGKWPGNETRSQCGQGLRRSQGDGVGVPVAHYLVFRGRVHAAASPPSPRGGSPWLSVTRLLLLFGWPLGRP
jgi:hypothetical protein